MNNANDVLAKARSQLGYSRWTDPNPGTIYGRWYAQYPGIPYYGTNGVPYCAMFVSWVFNQVGAKCAGLPAAYCPYIVRHAKAAKKTVSKANAKPGDVVLFDWEGNGVADQVGIVEKNNGSSMTCIEGNTDNGIVARKTRPYSCICCVVRPNYAAGITGPGIIQAAPNVTDSQLWRFEESGDWLIVKNKSGKVLDVKGGTQEPITDGRFVQAYKPNGTDAQLWKKIEGVGGGFRLVPKLDEGFCLDVKGGTVNARKNILLHRIQTDPSQMWAQSFTAAPYYGSGDWVSLLNVKSLYAIDANPSGYDYN